MSNLAKIHNYAQKLIDDAGKDTKKPLDFLDGFVYALLLIQSRIKEVNGEEKQRKN
jgi:hypothetical protein